MSQLAIAEARRDVLVAAGKLLADIAYGQGSEFADDVFERALGRYVEALAQDERERFPMQSISPPHD